MVNTTMRTTTDKSIVNTFLVIEKSNGRAFVTVSSPLLSVT